jgi:hypothetical protein
VTFGPALAPSDTYLAAPTFKSVSAAVPWISDLIKKHIPISVTPTTTQGMHGSDSGKTSNSSESINVTPGDQQETSASHYENASHGNGVTHNQAGEKENSTIATKTSNIDNHNCSSSSEIHIDEIVMGFLPASLLTHTSISNISRTTKSFNVFSTGQNQESVCGNVSISTASFDGAWYLLIGTGLSLRVTICVDGTKVPPSIVVFQGFCPVGGESTGLECIVGDHGSQQRCATVTWQAEIDAKYFIWVTGESGYFELSVTEMGPLPNDTCSSATTIGLSSFPGALVATGSTSNATRDFPNGMVCGVSLDYPGTWHQIEGTGSAITISSCTNATNYHAAISVFEGSCDELLCVAGMDDSIDFCEFGVAGTVTWLGHSGTIYHVYIHGAEGFDNSVGSYGLTATESPVVQSNDFCQQATEISSSGAAISGATNNATMDTIKSTHCGVPIVAPGVWYKVEGNGQAMQVSICSNVNTAVSIFTGSCDNLQCVTGKSSTCNNPIQDVASSSRLRPRQFQAINSTVGLSDALSWLSQEGEIYYLFVQGNSAGSASSVGSFRFDLTPVPTSTFYCQKLFTQYKEDHEYHDGSMTCDCVESGDGKVSLMCSSTCLHCNTLSTVCVEKESFGTTVSATADSVFRWESYRYVAGRNETLLVEYTENNSTTTCAVTVNDSLACSKCQLVSCMDGSQGLAVDCQNWEQGAFFVDCPGSLSPTLVEGNILEGLFGEGFDQCAHSIVPPSISPPYHQQTKMPSFSILGPISSPTTGKEVAPIAPPTGLWTKPPSLTYLMSPTSSTSMVSSAKRDNTALTWQLPRRVFLVVFAITIF